MVGFSMDTYEAIYREVDRVEYLDDLVSANSLIEAEDIMLSRRPDIVDLLITDGDNILRFSRE
jgi:hypothetical protein